MRTSLLTLSMRSSNSGKKEMMILHTFPWCSDLQSSSNQVQSFLNRNLMMENPKVFKKNRSTLFSLPRGVPSHLQSSGLQKFRQVYSSPNVFLILRMVMQLKIASLRRVRSSWYFLTSLKGKTLRTPRVSAATENLWLSRALQLRSTLCSLMISGCLLQQMVICINIINIWVEQQWGILGDNNGLQIMKQYSEQSQGGGGFREFRRQQWLCCLGHRPEVSS